MRALWNRFAIAWCQLFHPDASWPLHGRYHCPACLRTYPVPWAQGGPARTEFSELNRGWPRRGFVMFAFEKDRR